MSPAPQRLAGIGRMDRWFRGLVINRLAALRRGTIELTDWMGRSRWGESSELCAAIRVNDPRFFRRAVLGGTLSVAEAYLCGVWDCDDLPSLFRIFVRNADGTSRWDRGLARIAGLAHRLVHLGRRNSRTGSRRNIGEHYDLGNEFFRLWLDDTLAYSSGVFLAPENSMREASIEKFDRVCRKLDLRPQDQVLEIGTGWGGFALHAAENYGCHVTTTTISRQQSAIAQQRVQAAGLEERVTLLERDYRDLTGQFDKLVSIEMVEAVGQKFLDAYLGQCGRLLRPNGSMVVQAILMQECGYERYLRSADFIQRYVFPGGCLPSLAAILESAGRATDLRIVHMEDFAPHYAETLRRWRAAFESRIDEVRRLGYAERFIRLWRYYLCYCEAAFEERHIGVAQIQFDKPLCRRDPLDISRRAASARWPAAAASRVDRAKVGSTGIEERVCP